MSNKDSSKRDIAKQFDLPERQSKIASILKQTDVYCICRSTDSTRFMICCDSCEEWYHGDCINITESESRYIKQYFCPPCMEKNPSLEIEYKKAKPSVPKQKSKSSSSSVPAPSSKSKDRDRKPEKSSKKSSDYFPGRSGSCGSCSGCLAVIDCGRCDRCKKSQKYGDKRRLCRKRECTQKGEESDYKQPVERKSSSHNVLSERQLELSDEEDDWIPSPIKAKKLTPSKKGKRQQRKGMKEASKEKSRRKTSTRRQRDISSSESTESDSDSEDSEEEQQCLWLECVNAARPDSKYCSQDCCVKLATERLRKILPGRIQEWNLTPSVAEQHNKRDLEEVHKKQLETRNRITDLEIRRTELDKHVEKVQQLTVDPDNEDDEPDEEGIIHCITCGHEIAVKSCLKHMERCYNKYESQTSFGSIYKTKLEGIPIFCDFYNPIHGTYCKRLQVLCPEHSKEPKFGDDEICGSPLIKNMLELNGRFCQVPKKKCNKHFSWEKLRRAEIDMERVRNWLKLDELMEQERQLRMAMANRGSVMGLLLHSTFDHELRNRIQSQMQQENDQAQTEQQQASAVDNQTTKESEEDYEDEEVDAESTSSAEEEDFVREPLVKQRDKDKERRKSIAERDPATEKRKEVTASKLFKNIVSVQKH